VIDALRYEWLRMRTIRSTYWISGIAVTLGVGLSFLISMGSSIGFRDNGPPNRGEADFLAPAIATQFAAVNGPYILAYILGIMAVLVWGHEYRHGMIRATLTAIGSRSSVWAAKYAVLAVWVLAVALVTMLLSTAVGWLWLHDDGVRFGTSELWQQIGRSLVYVLLFTWIAASAASLLRNQTAALVAMFIWPLALEPLIRLILRAIPGLDTLDTISKYFPYTAGDRIMRSTTIGRALDELLTGDQISTWAGFAVFGIFAGALLGASYLLFLRRDA
jgi:ABC-2 type transport system permease protein